MYLIKVKHIGKDNTFTEEIQSANDSSWKLIKYERAVKRWFKILCPYSRDYYLDFCRNNEIKSILDELGSEYKSQCQSGNYENFDKFHFIEPDFVVKYIQNYLTFVNSFDGGVRSFNIIIEEIPDKIST